LTLAVDYASERGSLVVSAFDANGTPLLPGSMPAVVGVIADWSIARDAIDAAPRTGGVSTFSGSPYPRPIPGVAAERNLAGVSFAVANVTGFLARAIEAGAISSVVHGRS
jgi:hypothetical protein